MGDTRYTVARLAEAVKKVEVSSLLCAIRVTKITHLSALRGCESSRDKSARVEHIRTSSRYRGIYT
jgi:hypothetical protein